MASSWEIDRTWNRTRHEEISLELTIRTQTMDMAQETLSQIRRFVSDLDGSVDMGDSIFVTLSQKNSEPDIREPYPSETEVVSYGISRIGLRMESYSQEEKDAFDANLEREIEGTAEQNENSEAAIES